MSELLKPGELFSGCKILHPCGRGAYGVVYLAENAIGQKIVIKVIGNTAKSDRELQGLRRYMQVSGSHPSLLKVFHIGKMESAFYYTMEAADNLASAGEYLPATLGNLLRRGEKFSPEEAIDITRQLLDAVRVMHEANLIHRDIKPDNIILVNGQAKLSDPGLVVEDGSNATFAGTPGFIPHEVFSGESVSDKKADLFAIGKVFYCLVTGYSPKDYPTLPENMSVEVCRQIYPALSRMCNSNPARRFQSAEEFLSGLPEKIADPTRLEKMRNDFRNWKICNRKKFTHIILGIIFALLLGVCAISVILLLKELRQQKINAFKNTVSSFERSNLSRKELLLLQFEVDLPQKLARYQQLCENLDKAKQAGNWLKAAQTVDILRQFLAESALQLLPSIPKKKSSFEQDFKISALANGFLSTPLADSLDFKIKSRFSGKLHAFDRKLYAGWNGPTCHKEWNSQIYYSNPMIFIPRGAVRMDHSKETVQIPYHFWMAKNETLHEQFTHLMSISPHYSPHSNTPVERISWNDILFFCRRLTIEFRTNDILPPGYIVRIPTDAEWEYAAKNAWLGPDTTPFEQRAVFKDNSNSRTMPPGSRQPNKLGILDMYGNVSEIVSPLKAPVQPHSAAYRGGSYQSSKEKCFKQIPYLKYQCIPRDIGFRIVIAPGDMSYFDRNFLSELPTQIKTRGKIYELIGANYACFDKERSTALCKLLGGRLAEIEDAPHLNYISQFIPRGWECFVGGRKVNDKWIWEHSGRELNFGSWHASRKKSTSADRFLVLQSKRWKSVDNYKTVTFLCEWDEKDYPERNKNLRTSPKLPMELARFTANGKTFILINVPAPWYSAQRICELLGGRLACLDTPELKQIALQKLEKFSSKRIFLGGYAKFDQFFWLNGKVLAEVPEADKSMLIPSRNRNYVILRHGKLYNSQFSEGFLLELP